MKLVSLLSLISTVACGVIEGDHANYFSHAVLRIRPGQYNELNPELKEFMESS